MDLEEARGLKQVALKQVIKPLLERSALNGRVAFAATSLLNARSTQPNRTVAVGIARGKKPGDYRLAVRVQRQTLFGNAELDHLRQISAGEIDVRFVGRVHKRAAPWHQSRQRPLVIGSSVGHHQITAGSSEHSCAQGRRMTPCSSCPTTMSWRTRTARKQETASSSRVHWTAAGRRTRSARSSAS